jgi:hypothetical protein
MLRTKLADIITSGNREKLAQTWETTQAADELGPLPRGQYEARILNGEYARSQTGTPGYRLTFRVLEGEYAGRRFWHTAWLTDAALPLAKRDLGKLGITSLEQLDRPLPRGIRCKVDLALRRDDDGREYNRVRRFEVLGIDPPEKDPFAPVDGPEQEAQAAGPSSPATEGNP